MELEVADRVHIAPMGYEVERVVEPAIRLRADKVIILEYSKHGRKGEGYRVDVEAELEKEGVQTYQMTCDIFDFYETLGKIGEIVSRHHEDDVFVNVSTGSKVTAIAGMIGCMITGATPYYAKANNYETETPTDIGNITKLPDYPIQPPEAEEVQTLEYLLEKDEQGEKVTKGDLIHFSEKYGLPFITESDVQEKGKYRLLDTHIIEPLQEKGYIMITKSGRHKLVEITEEGENAIRAFRYLVDSDQHNLPNDAQ